MTLEMYLNTLRETDWVFVVQRSRLTMPAQGWKVDVREYMRIDDYLPEELLQATVVEQYPMELPITVVVDL